MVRRSVQRRVVLCALLPFVAACGSSIRNAVPAASPTNAEVAQTQTQAPEPAPLPQPPVEDPVPALIALSDQHFQAGQHDFEVGDVEAARRAFDGAVNVLIESPSGGAEPRIREHLDRLVDRISAYETNVLADGEGSTDSKSEPASIDELLAVSATFTQPPATPALRGTVESDLQNVAHDIPIPENQKVLSYIQLFQGRLHDFIQEGMTRGAKYLPMIQGVFRAEGLPLDLAYVPLIESAFKPSALSRSNAKGVWQFMRDTGAENGLRQDWYIDERSDPEKATAAAARYLSALAKHVRRRLAPRARVVQRRAWPGAARDEDRQGHRFLDAVGEARPAAARDTRVRADDSRGDRHRQKSGRVRVRVRARGASLLRHRDAALSGGSSSHRRMDRDDD